MTTLLPFKRLLDTISSIPLLFMLIVDAQAQYQWPFPTANQQGRVSGTIGEFRNSDGANRWHKGVDLTNGTNYAVHSINAGSIVIGGNGVDTYVQITSPTGLAIRYFHIAATSAITTKESNNQSVAVGLKPKHLQ